MEKITLLFLLHGLLHFIKSAVIELIVSPAKGSFCTDVLRQQDTGMKMVPEYFGNPTLVLLWR